MKWQMQSSFFSFNFFGIVLLISKEGNSQYRHTMVHSLLDALLSTLCYKQLDIGVGCNWKKKQCVIKRMR